jgi:Rad3-related DNA helicase
MDQNYKVIRPHIQTPAESFFQLSNVLCPVSHKNYSKKEFLEKLGDSVVKVVEGIPSGGVLVFLPSYALLRKCERLWNPDGNRSSRLAFWSQFEDSSGPSVWERLKALKHNVIVEPSGSNQTEFEEKKQEYMDSVDRFGGCV